MISPALIQRELVTKHNTYSRTTKHGRLSARKTAGRYRVTFEDFEVGKTTVQDFTTLRGALIALESWEAML